MKLYGIPGCSTVKKARDWLAQRDIAVEFHDFKKLGLDAATAEAWLQQTVWTKLINRSGLTWRELPEQRKQLIQDAASAQALMLEKTSVIKRPCWRKTAGCCMSVSTRRLILKYSTSNPDHFYVRNTTTCESPDRPPLAHT
jgi:Spx/MgsR family transcriptional regulator